MTSNLYRAILIRSMADAKIASESRFILFVLFSVIKNRDRLLRAMDTSELEDQSKECFT